MEMGGYGLFWPKLAWRFCAISPDITRCKSGSLSWQKEPELPGRSKKAIVAVARQLAVDLWRLHTGRCTPAVLGFK